MEPFPRKIAEVSELLSRLCQAEKDIETNRRDTVLRKQYEQQALVLRHQLLKQANYSLVYNYMEATKIADKNAFRAVWQQNLPPVIHQEWLTQFNCLPNMDLLPTGSFFIHFTFTLQKPYLSRDDNDFYIVDNPIVRDKVFRWPMVRPSAWKGCLRHALWQLGPQKEDKQIQRLFGSVKDNEDDGKRGCLNFYPTFFGESGLEVINPHERKTRVGKSPILMESAPIGSDGTFTLLYVPFNCIGQDEAEIHQQVTEDLAMTVKGLSAMMTTYGFGAKTSSGFGTTTDKVKNGMVNVKLTDFEFPTKDQMQVQEPNNDFRNYLDDKGYAKDSFQGIGAGGLLSNNEYGKNGAQAGGGTLSEFKRFRQWYQNHGAKWQNHLAAETTESDYPTHKFESLSELVTECEAIESDHKAGKEENV